jgi:hypothetical protein
MNAVLRRNLLLFAALTVPHLLLGAYAVYDGGSFIFGLIAPERYLRHFISGDESRVTVSGSLARVAADLCLQKCEGCPLNCYDPASLTLSGDGARTIRTASGVILASEGERFALAVIGFTAYENSTFMCYGGECGFDVGVGGNQTFSAALPANISVS